MRHERLHGDALRVVLLRKKSSRGRQTIKMPAGGGGRAWARLCESTSTYAFDAEYTAYSPHGYAPIPEDTLTIAPALRSAI